MKTLRTNKSFLTDLFLLPALIFGFGLLPVGPVTAQTTITVTSTADSGPGTLRDALASAANGDTIDGTGVTGTILLTSGELLVTNSVTVLGPGPANLAVDGNAASRVFNISGAVVTIAGLTITNGKAFNFPANSGGGIYSSPGTLTVSNCNLSGNSAGDTGGGIYNYGYTGTATVQIVTSTLRGNSAVNNGGGIYNAGEASVRIANSTLSGNSAQFGGGGIYNNGANFGNGTVQIATTTLSGNSASFGGGIYNDGKSYGKAALTVSNCNLSGNSVSASGGGIINDGTSSGKATLLVRASTFNGNSAINGGGIYNFGSSGTATVQIVTSTLSGNPASGNGGGIYNDGHSSTNVTLTVTASTLSSNAANVNGGGIYNDGTFSGKVALLVRASTFSGNSATVSGGGLYNNGSGGSASVEIGSTILKAGASGGNIANSSGTVSSDGYNLASDGAGGFLTGTADQINTEPMLGSLQDNGGPTFTHALLPGSPAIDRGKNLTGSATDQRGFPCTVDLASIPNAMGSDGTDIGAVEFQAPLLSNPGLGAGQYGFNLTGEPNQPVVVEASTNLVTWTPLATNTLGASPLHFNDPGSTNFRHHFYRAKLLP